ncbi:helix-turn-helix domain-containing protein [Rhizobium alvei]|uniref:helix-turn-helix domain-containing protein n=1 Tax=Rhizobium alvei TaxID=1132659 RepID=UPI0026EB782D|nr:XRE family transcriptional regulator [Rhizobium alvei]
MGNDATEFDLRIAVRLKKLRNDAGLSLDELAERSGISRATLSRLENGEVSPTAHVLGRLCPVYSLPMSRLISMVEQDFVPLVRPADQWLWSDPATGFRRRSISPPSNSLAGEVIACELDPGVVIDYPAPARRGLEHHLLMQAGRLEMTVDGQIHALEAGDCLRYQLNGPTRFEAGRESGACYLLFIV